MKTRIETWFDLLILLALIIALIATLGTPVDVFADDLKHKETLHQHSEWCDLAQGTRFGESLAMGDVDGDSYNDLAVASGREGEKKVYVYYGSMRGSLKLGSTLATKESTMTAYLANRM